jgi:hypothetical protein
MSNEQLHHWATNPDMVEAFVLHRLEEQEMPVLTAHLEQCGECRHHVQVEKDLIAGIRRYGRMKLKYRIEQQIHSTQGKRYDWTQAVSIAAAIIFMFGTVFAVRALVDFGQNKNRTREIVVNTNKPLQRALWITGRVTITTRQYTGITPHRSNRFIVKKGDIAQTILIQHAMLSELPYTQPSDDTVSIRTFLERTSRGLQLTLYTDEIADSSLTGVEPVTDDSLIVFYRDMQIAFHIPGGWAGRM